MADASRDSNRVPGLIANSNDSARTPVDLWADASTHRLLVNSNVGTGATDLGKAQDSAAGATDTGIANLIVRDDTLTTVTPADGDYMLQRGGQYGDTWVSLATLIAGEDQSIDVLKTEQRFSSSGVLTTDTAVKSAAGFLHTVTISQTDAAPTAGTIDIYNNTAASGTKLFTWNLTTAVFNPFTVILDVSFSTGLYVDFTTTADVAVVCSYR